MRAGRVPASSRAPTSRERPAEAPLLGDHTTADDASRYRPADEVKEHWKQEPIARLRACLVRRMNWSKTDEEKVARECEQRVEAAIERYLASKPRPPQSMFDHLYARLPAAYVAQRQILRTTIAAALYLISENRSSTRSWLSSRRARSSALSTLSSVGLTRLRAPVHIPTVQVEKTCA